MVKRISLVIMMLLLVQPMQGVYADPYDGAHRTPAFVERDCWRHPRETLAFFDVQPWMTVVEIWPAGGWYTEILAPLLKEPGKLYAAHFPDGIGVTFYDLSRERFEQKVAANPGIYGEMMISSFDPGRGILEVPEGAADRVLTFRNVHNWLRNDSEARAFRLFFRALKPGGVLGVVEHRAKEGTCRDVMLTSGYMTEDYVIELAEAAGFVLEAKSDINANPKDATVHPAGVWTLPPTLRLGAEDRNTYLNIGESDRMTLKFRKPVEP